MPRANFRNGKKCRDYTIILQVFFNLGWAFRSFPSPDAYATAGENIISYKLALYSIFLTISQNFQIMRETI